MSGREREKRRCLEVLGLPNTATEDDIKKMYRSLARQHHPDKNDGEDATQRFQEISYAYKYLIEGPPNTGNHGDSFECGIPVEILIRLFPWLFAGRSMFDPFERPRFRPSPFFMYDSSDDDDEYYDFCFHDEDSDSDCRPRERPYTPSYTAGNKNVNAKKERRREKKKRYEERRKQAKKADGSQQTGASRNTSESRKDVKSESAEKENRFPSEGARQKSTADEEQSERTASAGTKTQDEKLNEEEDRSQAQKSSKPAEGKKNVAETIASSWSNASQNMSEKIQNKEKKKKIQAEERKREKEILEIRRELERQEEIKAQKLAQKKEQEKRLAEERRKREEEEQERERLEMEKREKDRKEMERKEMERKEMERKEMEKKEMERKEMERREMERKAMERQEMERRQKEEYMKTQFTQDFHKVDKKNRMNKTKPVRPLKKVPPFGNMFSVLADSDEETLQQNKSAGVNDATKSKNNKTRFDIESSITMDALDDISDNEDLLVFASKNSFWCDPAMTGSGSGSSASKQGQGQPEKNSGRPELEKQKNKTFTFEALNRNSNNMYGMPTQGQGSTQSGFPGNVPQAATSTPVMSWADEMDDVDDGAISGSSPNTGDSLKQQPKSNNYYNNVRGTIDNKQASGSRGYAGNNRGASRGYGRNNGGAATSRNTTGASQSYGGNYTGASWASGENNTGASAGYGGNNRGAPQGYGGNNRGAPQGFGGNNRGGNNTGAPQGYGGNNRGAPQGFGGNIRGAQRGYGGNIGRGNKVFHNQQQSYYSGGPIQYSGGYGNQNFNSVGGRGFRFPISNQQRPYGAPQQGHPFANRFTYY